MKKLIFMFLTLCCMAFCFVLSACHMQDSLESSKSSSTESSAADHNISASKEAQDNDSISNFTEMDKEPTSEENKWVSEETPDNAKQESESGLTESMSEEMPEKDDHSQESAGTTSPPQYDSEKEETAVFSEPDIPQEPMAGASDTKAVAKEVQKYVNEFRNSPAVSLTGLTGYAEYRSRQIVSNFAHDTNDQRAAATALQYGEYVDPSVYGGSGEPYYRANAREAIAKAGYSGTVDEVALKLAILIKNSPNHWNYIGSSEYGYIAVGVTYESGMWYCVLTVATENTDKY